MIKKYEWNSEACRAVIFIWGGGLNRNRKSQLSSVKITIFVIWILFWQTQWTAKCNFDYKPGWQLESCTEYGNAFVIFLKLSFKKLPGFYLFFIVSHKYKRSFLVLALISLNFNKCVQLYVWFCHMVSLNFTLCLFPHINFHLIFISIIHLNLFLF